MFLARIAIAIGVNALALWVANAIWDSVSLHGFWAYFIGALVLGIANAVLKPILAILTLPLIIITLGLFSLVVNGILLAITAGLTDSLDVGGFLGVIVAAFLISVFEAVLGFVIDKVVPSS